MESSVSNLESKSDDFKTSQAKFWDDVIAGQAVILQQLKLLAEKLGVESSAPTPTHQPFIKSKSPLSLEKSDEIVLQLQSFHKEKVRAQEKRDEFWSHFRPRYKPKTRPCLRPIWKKFKKVRDNGKHLDDDSATFRSNPRFQVSFGFSLQPLAGESEKVFDLFDKEATDYVKSPPFLDSDCKTGTTNDLVSGFPVSECEIIGMEKKVVASKLLAKKGEDSLLCDVGLCSFPEVGSFPEVVLISVAKSGENDAHHVFVGLQQTVDIASLKLGFHEFTRDKGGTTIQRLFHSKSATVLESDCYILDIKLGYHTSIRDKGGTKFLSSFESMDLLASCVDSSLCVVINCSMGYYCKGIRDKGGTISQRFFISKSMNTDYVICFDCSKVVKCEGSIDDSMLIDGEYADNLGLHHLEACIDKNRKYDSKFTLFKFKTGCCVVCCVVLDRDYCMGIRDKGGGLKFRAGKKKSPNVREEVCRYYQAFILLFHVRRSCLEKAFGTTSTNHSATTSYHRCWDFVGCTSCNLGQKNDQESAAATEALFQRQHHSKDDAT